MAATGDKSPDAFRTIGELSQELGVAQHILRYWETKFSQLRPLQRAGNRRYYRPADVDLARRINHLLNIEGYTVRGVQKLLRGKSVDEATDRSVANVDTAPQHPQPAPPPPTAEPRPALDLRRLVSLRDQLVAALEE